MVANTHAPIASGNQPPAAILRSVAMKNEASMVAKNPVAKMQSTSG